MKDLEKKEEYSTVHFNVKKNLIEYDGRFKFDKKHMDTMQYCIENVIDNELLDLKHHIINHMVDAYFNKYNEKDKR